MRLHHRSHTGWRPCGRRFRCDFVQSAFSCCNCPGGRYSPNRINSCRDCPCGSYAGSGSSSWYAGTVPMHGIHVIACLRGLCAGAARRARRGSTAAPKHPRAAAAPAASMGQEAARAPAAREFAARLAARACWLIVCQFPASDTSGMVSIRPVERRRVPVAQRAGSKTAPANRPASIAPAARLARAQGNAIPRRAVTVPLGESATVRVRHAHPVLVGSMRHRATPVLTARQGSTPMGQARRRAEHVLRDTTAARDQRGPRSVAVLRSTAPLVSRLHLMCPLGTTQVPPALA